MNSKLKVNGDFTLPDSLNGYRRFLVHLRRSAKPLETVNPSPAELLENPGSFKEIYGLTGDRFFDELISTNILKVDKVGIDPREIFTSYLRAFEVRAFLFSLSEEQREKFKSITKAFLKDPNKHQFKGMIFAGGEVRVVAESGIATVISALAELTAMKFKSFSGTSAGTLMAASHACNGLNSEILRLNTETDFKSFVGKRETLEKWINDYLKEAYKLHTGIDIDKTPDKGVFKFKHLKELGNDLQVLSSVLFPYPQAFFLDRDLDKKFGLNPAEFPVSKAIGASLNLPGLFYKLTDTSFGNCFLENDKGKKFFQIDPGIWFAEHSLPLHLQTEEIEKFKNGKKPNPDLYFILGNLAVSGDQTAQLKKQGGLEGEQTKHYAGVVARTAFGIYDRFQDFISKNHIDRVKKIGMQRAYLQANCTVIDPRNNQIVGLRFGHLGVSPEVRKTIACGNIPTFNFTDNHRVKDELDLEKDHFNKPAIDVLHENFVVKSNGLPPSQLLMEDIRKANNLSSSYQMTKSLTAASL